MGVCGGVKVFLGGDLVIVIVFGVYRRWDWILWWVKGVWKNFLWWEDLFFWVWGVWEVGCFFEIWRLSWGFL